MVSRPETGSDPPIGSDRDSGRDMLCFGNQDYKNVLHFLLENC